MLKCIVKIKNKISLFLLGSISSKQKTLKTIQNQVFRNLDKMCKNLLDKLSHIFKKFIFYFRKHIYQQLITKKMIFFASSIAAIKIKVNFNIKSVPIQKKISKLYSGNRKGLFIIYKSLG